MMRSFLFVPGDSQRKMDKARHTAAHALILDLEDSVAAARKEEARTQTASFLAGERGAMKLFVRVNPFDSGLLLGDLAAVMPHRPAGIVLPKCSSAGEVARLGHHLDAMEALLGIPPGSTLVIPVVTETPQAVLALQSYACACPRLWGLMWGAEDLSAAMGASSNRHAGGAYRSPFRLARDLCLMAASAAGVVAIDTVHTDMRNLEALREEAHEARADGFGAKVAIHPAQCEPINAAFRTSEAEITWARAVLQALGSAQHGGVASLNGQMLDRPHELQALRILESAGAGVGTPPGTIDSPGTNP